MSQIICLLNPPDEDTSLYRTLRQVIRVPKGFTIEGFHCTCTFSLGIRTEATGYIHVRLGNREWDWNPDRGKPKLGDISGEPLQTVVGNVQLGQRRQLEESIREGNTW